MAFSGLTQASWISFMIIQVACCWMLQLLWNSSSRYISHWLILSLQQSYPSGILILQSLCDYGTYMWVFCSIDQKIHNYTMLLSWVGQVNRYLLNWELLDRLDWTWFAICLHLYFKFFYFSLSSFSFHFLQNKQIPRPFEGSRSFHLPDFASFPKVALYGWFSCTEM